MVPQHEQASTRGEGGGGGGGGGGERRRLVEFKGNDPTGTQKGWERLWDAEWTLESLVALVKEKARLPDRSQVELFQLDVDRQIQFVMEDADDVKAFHARIARTSLSGETIVLFTTASPLPSPRLASSLVPSRPCRRSPTSLSLSDPVSLLSPLSLRLKTDVALERFNVKAVPLSIRTWA
ncbi:hypothetical protein BDY24DRAFT_372718 [Mrakia frigida]|uniref:uncharacterized protein n=1 Tax=Mrakia frigida TaxID=29902 RepID=UPI003FCBFC0A